jgi:putative transposase
MITIPTGLRSSEESTTFKKGPIDMKTLSLMTVFSILCQEEPYLLELVRYIHLNPVRAGIVSSLAELDHFPYCGHGALVGTSVNDWQDIKGVLRLFLDEVNNARTRYHRFIEKGISSDYPSDFTGGGLIRSSGGWTQVIAARRDKIFQKSDERILGDGEFVDGVLLQAREQKERRYRLAAEGIDLDAVALRVCELLHTEMQDLFAPGKDPLRVKARSLYCYFAVRELGVSQAELARQFNLSPAGLTKSVRRGELLARCFTISKGSEDHRNFTAVLQVSPNICSNPFANRGEGVL